MLDYDSGLTGTITGGNYNDTTGTLAIINDRGMDLIGQVDVVDKSVSGIIPNGNPVATFYLSYQGAK